MRNGHSVRRVIILVLVSVWLMGWSDKWSTIKTEATKIKTVSARFVQKKHLRILSKPLTSEGVIRFKAPNSLRWEYTAPLNSILLSYQGETKRYFKNRDRFIPDTGASLQAMQFVMIEIQRWLGGKFDENPDFSASLIGKGKVVLTAKTRGLSAMINRIELQLSDRPGMIESVTIFEGENSYTRIEFQNVKLNSVIEPSIFQEIE